MIAFISSLIVLVTLAPAFALSPSSAPDVTLSTAKGDVLRLADLRGRVVLVDFWASWCPPCKTSFPALDAIYREYHEQGLEVVAVNVDERRRDAEAFLAGRPHALTVVFDPKGTSAQAFAVKGMPSSFLIDRGGVIRFAHTGYSGSSDAAYRRELRQLLSERQQP